MLTTHGGPTAAKASSLFVGEISERQGASAEVDGGSTAPTAEAGGRGRRRPDDRCERSPCAHPQVMPLPTKRERRLALRLRATELVGLLEGRR